MLVLCWSIKFDENYLNITPMTNLPTRAAIAPATATTLVSNTADTLNSMLEAAEAEENEDLKVEILKEAIRFGKFVKLILTR